MSLINFTCRGARDEEERERDREERRKNGSELIEIGVVYLERRAQDIKYGSRRGQRKQGSLTTRNNPRSLFGRKKFERRAEEERERES